MTDYYKYKRTFHLPWSPGSTNDDKMLTDTSSFKGKSIVVTEKMDGENTNMYPDRIHARSIDSSDHISRHWVKSLWGNIRHEIPTGWRICGENLYARHSIYYDQLPSFFMVYSIWDEKNMRLSWADTLVMCECLHLIPVREMYRGIFDEEYLKNLKIDRKIQEGYVIRNKEEFHYDDFSENVAKWVRPAHVITGDHWMFQEVFPNKLKI